MEETKFINKATIEYLKSKAGATIEQQLVVASKQLMSLEDQQQAVTNSLNYLGNHIKDTRLEILSEITNVRGVVIENYEEFVKTSNSLKQTNEELNVKINKLTKIFAGAILSVFILGVTLCLVLK